MIQVKRLGGHLDKWHGAVNCMIEDRVLYIKRNQPGICIAAYGDGQWTLVTTEESAEGWDR